MNSYNPMCTFLYDLPTPHWWLGLVTELHAFFFSIIFLDRNHIIHTVLFIWNGLLKYFSWDCVGCFILLNNVTKNHKGWQIYKEILRKKKAENLQQIWSNNQNDHLLQHLCITHYLHSCSCIIRLTKTHLYLHHQMCHHMLCVNIKITIKIHWY